MNATTPGTSGTIAPEVVIVGAGPTGLSAAAELRRLGVASVLVVDREREPGGVPRHCDHTGFGLQDLHRCMGGPLLRQEHDPASHR